MLKVDMHMHTNYLLVERKDMFTPKELIDKAVELKFDAIAITEHADYKDIEIDALKTYYDFKSYAESKNLLLIPGFERSIHGKHVLIFNYAKGNIHNIKTFKDLKKIKSNSNLIIAPHPFHIKHYCLGYNLTKNIGLFDAIEHCHVYTNIINPNIISEKIAKKYNKPLIALSDTHSQSQFGNN